jgi:hypothetical protein
VREFLSIKKTFLKTGLKFYPHTTSSSMEDVAPPVSGCRIVSIGYGNDREYKKIGSTKRAWGQDHGFFTRGARSSRGVIVASMVKPYVESPGLVTVSLQWNVYTPFLISRFFS